MIRQDLKTRLLPEIENCRSIRSFSARPVEEEKIESILEAGRIAPSAKNRQPWRFIVITDEDVRKQVEKAAYGQEHVGQAPVLIALGTTNVDYKMPNGQPSHPIDLSFAASFMLIQANAEGLGGCVITTYDEREMGEILTVPYKMSIVLLLAVGYPDLSDSERDSLRERKPLSSITSRNHW